MPCNLQSANVLILIRCTVRNVSSRQMKVFLDPSASVSQLKEMPVRLLPLVTLKQNEIKMFDFS